MKWLNKELADKFADVIKENYNHIIDRKPGWSGVINDIVIDGKVYQITYAQNTGVHFLFDVKDGSDTIATGDFPSREVSDEFMVIRFYSGEKVIFEYKLEG